MTPWASPSTDEMGETWAVEPREMSAYFLGPIPEGLYRGTLNLLIGRPRAIRSGGL
jgi:hypothetical protein